MDIEEFKEKIEKFISKNDPIERVHEKAIIANTIRLCLKYPGLANEYLSQLPKAVMDN